MYEASAMPDIADALFEHRHGTVIALEVSPNAHSDSFPAGYNTWRRTIGCHICVPAVKGKANRAIISLVAHQLDVPQSRVCIQSGAASSHKRVLIEGMNKPDLLMRLQEISP